MGFVHLHNHTEYSVLDGFQTPAELLAQVAEHSQHAVAITDHGTLGGAYKFAHACKQAGIKPILGIEAYSAVDGVDRFNPKVVQIPADDDVDGADDGDSASWKRKAYDHLTILVRNQAGWRNLMRIHNQSHLSFKGKPLIDYDLLAQHAEGLIVLTGCLGGPVAGHLARHRRSHQFQRQLAQFDSEHELELSLPVDHPDREPFEVERRRLQLLVEATIGGLDQARDNLTRLIAAVGKDNVYVELMSHGVASERLALRPLAELASEFDLPVVVTGDCHYSCPSHADTHEVWLADQSKRTITDPRRFRFNGEGYHVASEEEMRGKYPLSPSWQAGCDETVRIADRIDDWVLPGEHTRLPRFPNVPADYGDDHLAYLHDLVREGALARYGSPLPAAVKERLRTEEDVIAQIGMEDYFLIIHDMVSWARSTEPTSIQRAQGMTERTPIVVGPGRGSGAGSMCLYTLGVTNVEPLENQLLFERFLEPGRVGLPDVDVDFEQDRVEEIHQHLRDVYGVDHVARLGTFQMSRTKAAIKGVGRVLEQPKLAEKMASLVPVHGGKPMELGELWSSEEGRDFRNIVERDEAASSIIRHARVMENKIRGAGIHACGVIVSAEPLVDQIPLRLDRERLGADDLPWVSEWDGKDCESFGLVKLDALRLRNLDIAHLARDMIAEHFGVEVDLDHLPHPDDADDPRVQAVWDMLAQGRGGTLFQLGSQGMQELVEQVQPHSMGDLTAIGALYRPGPMAAGSHKAYADRKHGFESVTYDQWTRDRHEAEALHHIFKDTYGLCVAADTRVYSVDRGQGVPIRDIAVGELVQSFNQRLGRYEASPVTAKVCSGVKDTVVTTLCGGIRVRTTPEHQFLTRDGWKRADELTTSDAVASPWQCSLGQVQPRPLPTRWVHFEQQEPAGECEVFDITVADNHNFVGEGVVLHNCVYQEQVMRLSGVVAGFDAAERSKLRKAMGKKNPTMMDQVAKLFMERATRELTLDDGTVKPAWHPRTVEALLRDVRAAGQYLFNKSHAAAYGLVTFMTGFLLANWPAAYLAAVLAKTEDEETRRQAMRGLSQAGIELLPPDVNLGSLDTEVAGERCVRLGLAEVKGLSSGAELVLAERERRGPFLSLADLRSRVLRPNGARLSTTMLLALIESGACDSLGQREQMLASLYSDAEVDWHWPVVEAAARQRNRLGLVLGEHPMVTHRGRLAKERLPFFDQSARRPVSVQRALERGYGDQVVIGVLAEWSEHRYRRGTLARFTLEDHDQQVLQGVMFQVPEDPPMVGRLVGMAGTLKVQRRPQRDDEEEQVEERPQVELIASEAWMIDIDRAQPPTPPAGEGLAKIWSACAKAIG